MPQLTIEQRIRKLGITRAPGHTPTVVPPEIYLEIMEHVVEAERQFARHVGAARYFEIINAVSV